jgi:hypothetical protein
MMTDLLSDILKPVQWLSRARELLTACAVEIKNLREVIEAYQARCADLEAQLAALKRAQTKARTSPRKQDDTKASGAEGAAPG